MIQLLTGIFIFAYLIRSLKTILSLVFLWQLKEYRLDRMLSYLKTWQGRKVVFSWFSLFKWFLLFSFLLLFFLPAKSNSLLFAFLTVIIVTFLPVIIYPVEALVNLIQLFLGRWRFPKPTLKVFLLILFSLLFLCGSFLFLREWAISINEGFLIFIIPLVIDKLLSLFIALLVVFLSLPSLIYKKILILKTKKKLEHFPKLTVIGITGSYGKTSTKEFLSQILSTKFKVLKTQESQNTTIGVARTILQKLSDQEIFVCEMAAYKKGEIKEICGMVQPEIGIITGLNEQHLDLFGSLKKTMEAKYELIEALPKDGLAVFNGKNQYCLEMAEKAREEGLRIKIIKNINDIKVTPERLEFEVVSQNEKQKMSAHLLGKQNVENILLAISAAQALGMSLKEISVAVKKLEAPEKTMKLVSENLVDDTFNTNPDGVLAAIEYMKVYPGKKILILTPMIELGEAAGMAHEKVGRLAGEVCDLIILTNKNYYRDFIRGVKMSKKGKKEKIMIGNGEKARKKIKTLLKEDGVAVFEGKESARILND